MDHLAVGAKHRTGAELPKKFQDGTGMLRAEFEAQQNDAANLRTITKDSIRRFLLAYG